MTVESEEFLENLLFVDELKSFGQVGKELDKVEDFFIDTGDIDTGEEEERKVSLQPAWIDNSPAIIDIQSKKRLRKLRKVYDENQVDAQEYEKRLRMQFEKLNPTPKWAKLPDEESKENVGILATSAALIKPAIVLNPDRLDVCRVADANQAEYSQVTIQSLSFHPTAPVLLTAGLDKNLRLFHIDGKDNLKVQSYHIGDMPIISANFTPDGTQVIMTGRRNFFYSLELETGNTLRVTGIRGRDEKSFEHSFVSPCSQFIVVLGKNGYIIVLSASTKQWIANLKMNSGVVTVAFDLDNNLWSLGLDGSLYLWDMKTMECIKQFTDQGCIRGSALHISPDGKWIAVGSSSGIVNLYEIEKIDSEYPEPSKVFMNLTTSISHILFHPSSDLMVIASNDVKDALRIIHIPTKKVVKNWPTALTPLGYVFSIAFSHDGQYLAVGNDKGKALLFRLGAFSDLK